MKKLKWWHWLLIMLGFVIVTQVFWGEDIEQSKKEREALKNAPHELSTIVFDSMTIEQKKELSKLFLDGKSKPFQTHRYLLTQQIRLAFEQSVKFPETLEYQFGSIWTDNFMISSETASATDAEKGTYRMVNDYKCENNFGQKVRNTYQISFTYNGIAFEVTDAKLK